MGAYVLGCMPWILKDWCDIDVGNGVSALVSLGGEDREPGKRPIGWRDWGADLLQAADHCYTEVFPAESRPFEQPGPELLVTRRLPRSSGGVLPVSFATLRMVWEEQAITVDMQVLGLFRNYLYPIHTPDNPYTDTAVLGLRGDRGALDGRIPGSFWDALRERLARDEVAG